MSYISNKTAVQTIASQINSFQTRAREFLIGAKYAMVYSHEEKMLIALPPENALSAQFSHATDYASGVFEGSSAMVNERTGVPHVILLEARSKRLFKRSLPARGYASPVSREIFNQAVMDIVAINGISLFNNPNPQNKNKYARAYIRPTIHPAPLEGYGISMRKNYPINAAIIAWTWPDYFNPDLYTQGAVAAITGHQRLFPITGKHASNYGAAVKDGNLARDLGSDELIYLAPYLINAQGTTYWADPGDVDKKLRDGVVSDGPGEEYLALTSDLKTLIYAPMRVNRLGGTVLQYIIDHLAKNIGLETKEADITLHDLRGKKYAAVCMVGNAVKVTPVRQINCYKHGKIIETIELFTKGNISQPLNMLIERWDKETRGLIDPSHPSLTSSVDLSKGTQIRELLDKIYYS